MKFYILIFNIITIFLISCNNDDKDYENEKRTLIKKDSIKKINTKIEFDRIGAIADFITNSGGRLTTKETRAIYFADTNITGNMVNYAFTLIEDRKFDLAFYYLNKALVKNKSYAADVYLYKGIAWGMINNKDSLYYYFNKAVHEDSTSIKYLEYRAMAYAEDSLFQYAVDDITKAIERQPNNTALRVIRGHYKIGVNDIKGAAEDMQKIPENMKKNYMVYRDRGYIAMILGGYKSSVEQCDISISLNPSNGNAYTIRGVSRSKLGNWDGAYSDFKKADSLGDRDGTKYLRQYEEYYRTHKNI